MLALSLADETALLVKTLSTGTSHTGPCSFFLYCKVICTPKCQKLHNSVILYYLIEQKPFIARNNLYIYTKIGGNNMLPRYKKQQQSCKRSEINVC
jgi:hypothetical protein